MMDHGNSGSENIYVILYLLELDFFPGSFASAQVINSNSNDIPRHFALSFWVVWHVPGRCRRMVMMMMVVCVASFVSSEYVFEGKLVGTRRRLRTHTPKPKKKRR